MARKLIDRDLIAGLGAAVFAVVSLFVVQLQRLCSPEVAGLFAMTALTIWWKKGRGQDPAEAETSDIWPEPPPDDATNPINVSQKGASDEQ